MNIASAFLMGTKIKETEVPDDPWTKRTTLPNNTGVNVMRSGIAYKGKIYATFGRQSLAQYATGSATIYEFDGTTWSESTTLTIPASQYTGWTFDAGTMLFFIHAGKMYVTHAHFGDYGLGGPKMGWVFDGNTWEWWNVPTGNLSQAIEKDGKLYLFEVHSRGTYYPGYWWNVYEYNDSDGTATLVAQNVADNQINHGLQDGSTILVDLNGTLHCMGGIADTNTCKHGIINDDWSYTALHNMYPTISTMIVYKNKIHGFGSGEVWSPYVKSHVTWDSVNEVWEKAEETPYFATDTSKYYIPRPIIYKNKLWLLGACRSSGYSDTYNSKFDDIYRYNK